MNYSVSAWSSRADEGEVKSGDNEISFGVSSENNLPTPADLLVSAFAACCLKNVERFSEFIHFQYERAEIEVDAIRQQKPPMIQKISYNLIVISIDDINLDLLSKNLQKFGTIYNTLNASCEIEGKISIKRP